MIVKVADYCGPICITVDTGTTIYNLIKNSKNIVLDFEGITYVAAPFANFAVGNYQTYL